MDTNAVHDLANAQMARKVPRKDAVNPFHKNKYATLNSCMAAIKPALNQNNFAIVQCGGKDEFGHYVETKFVHTSGKEFVSKIYLELEKAGMQAIGSAITYAKRYGLLGLSGMEPDENPDDDDANKTTVLHGGHNKEAVTPSAPRHGTNGQPPGLNEPPLNPHNLNQWDLWLEEQKHKLQHMTELWQLRKWEETSLKERQQLKAEKPSILAVLGTAFNQNRERLNNGVR